MTRVNKFLRNALTQNRLPDIRLQIKADSVMAHHRYRHNLDLIFYYHSRHYQNLILTLSASQVGRSRAVKRDGHWLF
jgi:hypothetical protein